jgi:hypothetical protein
VRVDLDRTAELDLPELLGGATRADPVSGSREPRTCMSRGVGGPPPRRLARATERR